MKKITYILKIDMEILFWEICLYAFLLRVKMIRLTYGAGVLKMVINVYYMIYKQKIYFANVCWVQIHTMRLKYIFIFSVHILKFNFTDPTTFCL